MTARVLEDCCLKMQACWSCRRDSLVSVSPSDSDSDFERCLSGPIERHVAAELPSMFLQRFCTCRKGMKHLTSLGMKSSKENCSNALLQQKQKPCRMLAASCAIFCAISRSLGKGT